MILFIWILRLNRSMTEEKGWERVRKVRLTFDPSGSPFERGEGNKEDPLTFRLALNEG